MLVDPETIQEMASDFEREEMREAIDTCFQTLCESKCAGERWEIFHTILSVLTGEAVNKGYISLREYEDVMLTDWRSIM
jgi:hypothetical protein